MPMTVDDTSALIRNQPRRCVDSDASSFYFRPSAPPPAPGTVVHVVIVAVDPTCLYRRKLLQSVSTTAALVNIAEMIRLSVQARSLWRMHGFVMSDISAVHLG